MSRSRYVLNFQGSPQLVEQKMVSMLAENGFRLKGGPEPNVYQKGVGFLTAPKYIHFEVYEAQLMMEAWVKNFLIFESDLEGFSGIIPKKALKDIVQGFTYQLRQIPGVSFY